MEMSEVSVVIDAQQWHDVSRRAAGRLNISCKQTALVHAATTRLAVIRYRHILGMETFTSGDVLPPRRAPGRQGAQRSRRALGPTLTGNQFELRYRVFCPLCATAQLRLDSLRTTCAPRSATYRASPAGSNAMP